MSGEQPTGQDTPAVDSEVTPPAAATDTAASPTSGTQAEEQVEKAAEVKTFTQEELDDIIKREKAKAEAKAERRVLKSLEKLTPQPQPMRQEVQQVEQRPSRRDGESDDDYLDRLTDWKLEKRDRDAQQARAAEQSRSTLDKTEKMYAEASKIPGFDREDFDALPLTPTIAQALIDSDVTPKLMAYMSSNPDEVSRIANLSPARQAAEIGKLETKLASQPVKTTKTPPPITPVGGGNTSTRSLANTNNMDDYIAMRKKQNPVWAR